MSEVVRPAAVPWSSGLFGAVNASRKSNGDSRKVSASSPESNCSKTYLANSTHPTHSALSVTHPSPRTQNFFARHAFLASPARLAHLAPRAFPGAYPPPFGGDSLVGIA